MAIDVEKYRRRLIEERDRLNERAGTISGADLPTSDDRQIDAGDAQLLSEGIDIEAEVTDLLATRLDAIEAALQRIDQGVYGICAVGGEEIDERRLDAEPTALTCVKHAPAEEKEYVPPEM